MSETVKMCTKKKTNGTMIMQKPFEWEIYTRRRREGTHHHHHHQIVDIHNSPPAATNESCCSLLSHPPTPPDPANFPKQQKRQSQANKSQLITNSEELFA